MAVVVFDVDAFREAYPQFVAFTNAQLHNAFTIATLILDNSDASNVPDISRRALLLNLLVCHLCTLAQRGNVVGTQTNASEGSVSVAFSLPAHINGAWFAQTPCGLTFWQVTTALRGGRYVEGHCCRW